MDTDMKLKSSLVIVMMAVLIMTAILPVLNMVPGSCVITESENEFSYESTYLMSTVEDTTLEISLYDYFKPGWETFDMIYLGENLAHEMLDDGVEVVNILEWLMLTS